ncbi:MAG: peptidase M48 [Balneolaceae bacterium]|nr:MAG: peptidase M48 [Balneolaceae bacterium]
MLFTFSSSCVVQQSPVSGVNRAYAYSWNQEVEIGRQVDSEIVAEFGYYNDEIVQNYFTGLGELILENSHMRREDTAEQFRNTEFTFRILDSPVVNAFALPGGYVYVTRGLMVHMNNEAQLAVVTGHEIGHVAARHASQRGLQQMVGQIVVIGGAILGQELLGLPGESILNLSGTAAQLLFLRNSREHERESDRLGVEYAAKSGFDAAEGAAFFTTLRRLSDRAGQTLPNFLSTHPDPGQRERSIPELALVWAERGVEQNRVNGREYLEMIRGMTFGENPRNGFTEEGIYYHPELEFQFAYPENWQIVNQPTRVVAISPGRDGVMILRTDPDSETARESVGSFLRANDIEPESERSLRSSGRYAGYEAVFTIEEENGDRLKVQIYAVEYAGRVYRFVNYTDEDKFSSYSMDFTLSVASFNALTDPLKLAIQPVRIELVEVQQSISLRELLPSELPMQIDPEEVAIINQLQLDERIEAGSLIKIPVQD